MRSENYTPAVSHTNITFFKFNVCGEEEDVWGHEHGVDV